MTSVKLVVVGDVLLDRDVNGVVHRLCPDAPAPVVEDAVVTSRPGGAGLAALLAARDGCDVTLVGALSEDDGGRELHRLLRAGGVTVRDVGLSGPTPQKIRVRVEGRSLLRIDRGERGHAVGSPDEAATSVLFEADAVLVSDYGRGVAAQPALRRALRRVAAPVVWDPHPRGPAPLPLATMTTPNLGEVMGVTGMTARDVGAIADAALHVLQRWRCAAVAVTLGARGAVLVDGAGEPFVAPAPPVAVGDPCGAGDRFASAAACALASGATFSSAVGMAVAAASAFVADGGASAVAVEPAGEPAPAPHTAVELARSVRSRGGTVVATGGCFDLIHAGHVEMLRAARSLGDALIVCLNSDESVRRLKGPGRPLVGQADRAAVLAALDAVDAVAVFDDDTPAAVLQEIRPHIFAKGGDYKVSDLPEASVLSDWGGRAVVLPYIEGRSTTRLLEEVLKRA